MTDIIETRANTRIICELPKTGTVVVSFDPETQTFNTEVIEDDPIV